MKSKSVSVSLRIHARCGIYKYVENKKRFTDARVLEFPKGSNWKQVWKEVRLLAVEENVTIGKIVLDVLRDYVEKKRKKKKKELIEE